MIIVSDTSALDALLKIGEVDLLHRLFDRVVVPAEVFLELSEGHEILPAWLEVQRLPATSSLQDLLAELHRGEAAAIALAEAIHPDHLLVDERKARRIAAMRGLPILGLAGALALARRRLMIGNLRTFLLRLKLNARFRLSTAVIEQLCSEFDD